jgi:hypothetical protein
MRSRDFVAAALVFSSGAGFFWPRTALGGDEKQICLTAADQGQSLRDDGKYMAAREQFFVCARDVCPKLVHDQCTEWVRQIDDATPTVVFGAKDAQGNDVMSARILADGKLVASALDGKPVTLDPGPHDIRFERDPVESVTVRVVLRTGEKNRDVSVAFPSEGVSAGGGGNASGSPGAFGRARLPTSISLIAGGAVAIGLGVFFGLQSLSERNTADGIVAGFADPRRACADPIAVANADACGRLGSARDSQNRDALLDGVFYATGGVLVAAAAATWFLWPKSRDASPGAVGYVAPTLGPGTAGVSLKGSF